MAERVDDKSDTRPESSRGASCQTHRREVKDLRVTLQSLWMQRNVQVVADPPWGRLKPDCTRLSRCDSILEWHSRHRDGHSASAALQHYQSIHAPRESCMM